MAIGFAEFLRLGWALTATLATVCTLPGTVLAATDDPLTLRYRGTIAGVVIGSIAATITEDKAGYRVESHMVTEGPLAVLLPWDAKAVSHGKIEGTAARAERFWSSGTYKSEQRHMQVTWTGDAPRVDSAVPDPAKKPERIVPAALRRGTVDPLTAFFVAGRRLERGGATCGGAPIAVFDGRSRYDIVLSDDAAVPTVPTANALAVRCQVRYVPIAGMKDVRKAQSEAEKRRATIWFQRIRPGSPAVPARLEAESGFGLLAIDLVSVSPEPEKTAKR